MPYRPYAAMGIREDGAATTVWKAQCDIACGAPIVEENLFFMRRNGFSIISNEQAATPHAQNSAIIENRMCACFDKT